MTKGWQKLSNVGWKNVYYALGDEETVTAYKRAVRADPGYLSPHYNLGRNITKRRDFPAARRHFEERIRQRPIRHMDVSVHIRHQRA